jgi:TonB-linked SusC/RagA family outer membrane protein
MNPVGILNEAEAEERGVRILGNTFASYSLVQGVNARLSLGLDQYTNRSHTWDSPVFGPYSSSGGSVEDGAALASRVTYEGTINFNRALSTRHEVSGVVGASYEDNATETNYVQGTQLPNEFFKYVTSAATISGGTSTRNDWALVSGFGRVSYTFDDRVTATFNVRRDGSSRFGAENRFGTFPSASLLWRVGEEGFMQNQDLISNLALRVSYGRTGNQQGIGNFASRGLFSGTNQGYNDQPGISQTQLANPALRWETTDQLNVGTDFSVLNDRLSFTADYYDKQTRDLLTQRPVPRTTGFSSIWDNVGSIENKGFEVAARAQIVRGTPQAFNWTANVNVSRNRNKVTALYNGLGFNSGTRSIARAEVGYPLGSFYGYVTDGLFQEMSEICFDTRGGQFCAGKGAYQGTALTRPGDIRFKDLNGDGLITAADRTVIGSPWPDYEGGITNTLSFGGLDLTAFVHFSRGNQVANLNRVFTDRYGSGGDNNSTRALQRWTPENRNTTEPRAVWGDPNGNAQVSDRFIEDGSYWRLKNAVLGYTLPGSVASRLGIGLRTARVYVQGQNLFTSTNYSGLDPEVNYLGASSTVRGVDFYTLPQARTITAGFNVGL